MVSSIPVGDGAPTPVPVPVPIPVGELCVVAVVDMIVVKLEQYSELKFVLLEKYWEDEETSKNKNTAAYLASEAKYNGP